jgi:Zn-dependent M28 family amino/carboxypeptidase
MRRLLALACTAVALTACGSPAPAPAPVSARDLADRVSADAMYTHLTKLDEIGARQPGTPGFDAAVDYIAGVLRDTGFDVQTPEFEWLDSADPGAPTLEVAGRRYPVDQGSPLVPTAPGGLTALSTRPVTPAGCTAADYRGGTRGALVIVDALGCSVVDKQNAAVAAGAAGLLVVATDGVPGLFPPGYYQQLKVPVAIIDRATDAALRRTTSPVRLTLDAKATLARSRNVIAQTRTGAAGNVIAVGAQLDSAPGSPGINDNGTGVAALLATATALGSRPEIANAVRFTFWGSENLGAASKYLAGLDPGQRADIAMYLDADALGSPNAGFFTVDGDQSGASNPDIPSVPGGSAGIERTLAGYLNLAGVRPADMPLDRRSDYGAFLAVGIPAGGVTTGTQQKKTPVQARLWGGKAGAPFDPNAGGPGDGIGNVDRRALSITGPAIAFAVGTYAQSTDGPNGVPHRKP